MHKLLMNKTLKNSLKDTSTDDKVMSKIKVASFLDMVYTQISLIKDIW